MSGARHKSPVGWVPSPQLKEECKRILHTASQGSLRLEGLSAVDFLKKSGLSKDVLREIWLIADYNQQGYLGLDEFCVACRLIAMVQDGKPATKEALQTFSWVPLPPPSFKDVNSGSTPLAVGASDPTLDMQGPIESNTNIWVLTDEERSRFEQQFFDENLDENGQLPAAGAVRLLSSTGLPKVDLKKIWDLSRIEGATSSGIDSDEFCIAMKLCEVVAKLNIPVPSALPAELKGGETEQATQAASVPPQSQIQHLPKAPTVIDHRTPAQRKADELLAEMDKEDEMKQKAISDKKRAEEEEIDRRNKAQAFEISQRSATSEANQHASFLKQFQQVVQHVAVEEQVNRELREQSNRVRALEQVYKRLCERLQEERIHLKADAVALKHRLQSLETEYQTARKKLVEADTNLQSLRFEATA